MPSSELVTLKAASSSVAAVVNTANTIYTQIKAHGTANAHQRELLRLRLEEARAYETAEGVVALTRQKFVHMRELFDAAAEYEGTARHPYLFQTAVEATRMLEDNIRNYMRRVR